MQELLKKIEVATAAFNAEVAKTTNKSAQGRARKLSLELRELYKQFRVLSVTSKNNRRWLY